MRNIVLTGSALAAGSLRENRLPTREVGYPYPVFVDGNR